VLASPRLLAVLCATSLAATAVACSGDHEAAEADHHDHAKEPDESLGASSAALVATDTVATAVNQSCSTTAVKALATQLVEEIQCLRPATFARIDKTAGLTLGAAVFPFLQTTAASALVAAQKARGVTMSINSGLRTLPQQYLLYRWYQTGRCGIGLAARPGTSNHESALAIDINDNAGWRTALTGKSFRWLGASDPVHYDFVGGGTVDLRGLSVRAFQRLWNRNNPTDKIAEDGSYGPATEQRLSRSPVGGFAKGADCSKPMTADAGSDADPPANSSPADVPVIPDATESPDDDGANNTSPPAGPGAQAPERVVEDPVGCSASPRSSGGAAFGGLALAAAALVIAARRAARRPRA
jgi:hypothetical protein